MNKEQFKEIRLKHGLSQKAFAEVFHRQERWTQRVEYGELPVPFWFEPCVKFFSKRLKENNNKK